MKPKWQKLASLAQEICTLLFQFSGAVFAWLPSKQSEYPCMPPFKSSLQTKMMFIYCTANSN